MKKLFLTLALLVCAACGKQEEAGNLSIITTAGQKHNFTVELATDSESWAKGLMFRESMAPDAGMLFIFPEKAERRFWMKNTLIPLDLLFLEDDGRIHSMALNAVPHSKTLIPSMGAVRYVLEINGGLAQKLGLQPGDRVESPYIKAP